jgi:acetylornithine deacetylase/succinyl-diaminopimelate desuccinylase-like protein
VGHGLSSLPNVPRRALARALLPVLQGAAEQPLVVLPTLGGSLPLHIFADVLRVPIVILPIANHDDNQHAADENLRVQNLRDGIALFAAVLAEWGHEWGQVLN